MTVRVGPAGRRRDAATRVSLGGDLVGYEPRGGGPGTAVSGGPPCPDHHTSGRFPHPLGAGRAAQMVTVPTHGEAARDSVRRHRPPGVWGGRRLVSIITWRMALGCPPPEWIFAGQQ